MSLLFALMSIEFQYFVSEIVRIAIFSYVNLLNFNVLVLKPIAFQLLFV